MAGKSDVMAGRAFVSLFLKDDMTKALAKSLGKAGESMRSFGAGVMKAGAAISAAGTAALAPLAGAVKAYVDMGGSAIDAAARTGLSIEALSELGFAAQQTGATLDDIEIAMKKIAKGGFARAGETAEQTFSRLAAEVAAIEDPMLRAAKAQEYFGRSGTKLLPMISDLESLRAKARELGIVMSTEDAAAADDLGDAIDQVKTQVSALAFQVGAAVAKPLMTFAKRVQELVPITINWVKENQQVIVTAAKIALGVVAAGGAITAFGAAVWGLGFVLTAAGAIIGAVGSAIALLTSPIGLVTAALVAGAVWWAKYTESGQDVVQWFSSSFGPMVETVKAAFGGIAQAIQNGNLSDALAIAFAGLKVVAAQGLDVLKSLVGDSLGNIVGLLGSGDFAGAWGQAINGLSLIWESFSKGIVDTFTGAADIIMQTWLKATSWITDKIFDLAKQEGPIGDAMAKILGVDLRKMDEANNRRAFEAKRQSISLMEDQLAEAEKGGNATKADDLRTRIQTARDELGAGIYGAPEADDPFAASKQAARDQLAGQIAGTQAALQRARDDAAAKQDAAASRFASGNQAASQGLSEAARKAQEELDALLAKQKAAGLAPKTMPGASPPVASSAPGAAPIPGLTAPASSVAIGPTFSAAAAQAMGQTGGGPQEKMATNIYEMKNAVVELGLLSREQAKDTKEAVAMYQRFLAAFQYG